GTTLEVLLFSFALADRINILKKEKEDSQRAALEALKENEKIVREQNIVLETKVKERTVELETSNKNLKDAQSQLVNAEKMASLGQLTAGIAHEINNPINFVVSNVKPLKRDVEDILLLLTKYGEIQDDKNLSEKLKNIKELKEQLDADYLIEEINQLLKGIDEGASRTSEIVRGLKNFSRLDEDDLKLADIHEGIDSTLAVLNNNIVKAGVTIVKEYNKFPPIECYPGKLNQVFMNILNNAIQVLVSSKADHGEIRIKTALIEKTVRISIKDNGPGMTEEVKHKIFEPFFTTKNVGEGTGLGLSIAYGIIEKHKGEIHVESAPGNGAEFIITLPVQ
ncbi:MAG TPA: ATP-binding protein, partial [Bacteroidia bacterium]|nr:ATP-binding protein [Bacteroidia bacterium]